MPIQHIVLFDGNERNNLLPLTATRAMADLRVGILTIKEKWAAYFKTEIDVLTQDYLQAKYTYEQKPNTIFINAAVLPIIDLVNEIKSLNENEILKINNDVIAFSTNKQVGNNLSAIQKDLIIKLSNCQIIKLNYPWNIFFLITDKK